ncbi:MAG: hypothetical protein EBR27_11455 [Betaproteobacteria bacterium]|nr:hypothetical protein [Betaproteobacteria bacterium]
MVYTQDDYSKKSQRERIMLNILFNQIYNKGELQDNIYHTAIDSKEEYDSIVCRFKNNKIYQNHIWEAKIRNVDYIDILFEKNKYNSLKKVCKRFDGAPCEIYYVSTHPSGTYVFNITKIERDNKLTWITQNHNISTVEIWKGKKEKDIIYLPIELAKKVNIKVSDIDIIEKELKEKSLPKKKVVGFTLD